MRYTRRYHPVKLYVKTRSMTTRAQYWSEMTIVLLGIITKIIQRRLALQREADVHHTFRFGSWFLEPSKMQHISRQENILWSVRTLSPTGWTYECTHILVWFFLDVQCGFQMKTENENDFEMWNMNNWNAELSFILCPCFVKRPTTYVFANTYSI